MKWIQPLRKLTELFELGCSMLETWQLRCFWEARSWLLHKVVLMGLYKLGVFWGIVWVVLQ